MRTNILKKYEEHISKWHTWFAWRPVIVDDEIVWLQLLDRKNDPFVYGWLYRFKEAQDDK